MSDVHDDVDAAPSAAEPQVDPQAQVTSPDAPERPIENLKAEFDRKLGKMASQLEALIQFQAVNQQAAPPRLPSTPQPTQVSNEELWTLAQNGNREAFEEYQRRIARTEAQQVQGIQQRNALIGGQLQALVAMYPVLNTDPTHPLSLKTKEAYSLLLQNGYQAGPATLLEATQKAIADSPQIVSDLYRSSPAPAREASRQSATGRAQAGVMGASSRQDAMPRPSAQKQISPEERLIGRRMGLKTDEQILRAKKNFLKRQDDGTSRLGAVGAQLNTEDL